MWKRKKSDHRAEWAREADRQTFWSAAEAERLPRLTQRDAEAVLSFARLHDKQHPAVSDSEWLVWLFSTL